MRIDVHIFPDERTVDRLESILTRFEKGLARMSAQADTLDLEIASMTQNVANEESADASAKVLMDSIPTLIANAIATALSQGATPAQLASLSALAARLTASSSAIVAAVAADTPQAAAAAVAKLPAPV